MTDKILIIKNLIALFIISFLILIIYVILIIQFIRGWKNISEFKSTYRENNQKISVIIAVKNEEDTLPKLFESIQNLNYPNNDFEVILINDCSTDATKKYIMEYCHQNLNFIYGETEKNRSGKKNAIIKGIELSNYELIITTDADCELNENWLSAFSDYYSEHRPKMIVGPVELKYKRLFQKLQALEFASLIATTAGTIGRKMPVMCNGANLAFEKSTFYEFIDPLNSKIQSGDDIFLLHKLKKKYRNQIHFLKNKNALVKTEAKKTIKDFIKQRIRWTSKSKHYKDKETIFVAIFTLLANMIIATCFVYGLFKIEYFYFFLICFVTKSIPEYILVSKYLEFINKKNLMKFFIPLQFVYVFYILLIGVLGNFLKVKWK